MNRRMVVAVAAIATALMAFAGTASADGLTSPTGTEYTGALAIASEGHLVLDNPIARIECNGTATGTVEDHPAGGKVSGNVHPTFSSCTNSWHTTTIAGGTIKAEHNGTGYNGTAYSDGATIDMTRFGITCRYATSTTKLGTVTGGSPATIHIAAAIPFHSGSGLCGDGATTWTGSYAVNTPGSLYVDNS